MKAVNELLALIACALAVGALTLVSANWAQTAPSAPADAPSCVTMEDDFGWVPLRCGNHLGSFGLR
jgi:hypothetical protein